MKALPPRFLADESLDFAVVRSLRAAGYDVFAVCESMPGAADSDLIALAAEENRVLITEDKDFGWLVFASHSQSAGVILIRFPGNVREGLVRAIDELVRSEAEKLVDSFVVVQPGQVRISKRPDLPRV